MDERFPKCKREEYALLPKLDKFYVSIDTKQQIRALYNIIKGVNFVGVKYSSFNIEFRLLDVLCRGKDYEFMKIVRKRLEGEWKDDDTIYFFLRKELEKHYNDKKKTIIPLTLCKGDETFAQNVYHYLDGLDKKIVNYLDVGAGSGEKSAMVGEKLGLDPENIYAMDYKTFDEKTWRRNEEINFIDLVSGDEPYPFKNNFFTLISAIMVLHHVPDLDFVMKEISRVAKKGCIFFVKEHNAFTSADHLIADVEHAMFDIVYAKNPKLDFRTENYSKYYNWISLTEIIEQYGFELIKQGNMDNSVIPYQGSTAPCYMVYRKK